MHVLRTLRNTLSAALATLFAAASILYGGLWIYSAYRGVPVELGFDNEYLPTARVQLVQSVKPGSPAESAGMKPGDRITGINGAPMQGEDTLTRIWSQHKPGDSVELDIQRPGVSTPLVLHAIFRSSSPDSGEAGVVQHLGQDINRLFPVAFLAVGLAVLFLRLEDPNAWLLALMFCGFIAIPGFANSFLSVPPALRPFAMIYRAILNNMVAAFFYFFFAVFPTPSPLDRRVPWLKWVGLGVGAALALPGLRSGYAGGLPSLGWMSAGPERVSILCFNYGLIVLGFISLTWNAVTVSSSEAQRKIRVILWGTLVGVVPATLALAANDFLAFHISFWIGTIIIVSLWLFPLSFAYAVVKHRVLEIPVLLRRSARYLLVQRGFVLLLVLLSVGVTLAFALFFARYLQLTKAAVPGGIALGTAFGTVLLWTGTRVQKDVGRRIDRAFFRSAYDARVILEDLVAKTRTATDRKELAGLLEHHLQQALQPSSLVVFLETSEDQLAVAAGEVPADLRFTSRAQPALAELARNGQPVDMSSDVANQVIVQLPLAPLRPDCLVPILGRDSRLIGIVVLGLRLSEEPYSREDKQLLAAVASQAGIALDSIRLGENVAERIEAERRATQEMEFARQVQTRLFPQKLPMMKTLEYTGACIPARTVGGDYYDFLELRPGRLGLVLADIAGKGVPGALLMANLQANLRSQYAMAVADLPRLLASVNRLFYQSTDQASYATLFFADYDDSSRVLRYVNGGHLSPLLLHACTNSQHRDSETGEIEWLRPTCTVLGLFEDWQCEIAQTRLAPGDTLVLYTDGVTEAASGNGTEFGEAHLLDALRNRSQLGAEQILQGIVTAVRQFSGGGEQQDDITLVIARCLA